MPHKPWKAFKQMVCVLPCSHVYCYAALLPLPHVQPPLVVTSVTVIPSAVKPSNTVQVIVVLQDPVTVNGTLDVTSQRTDITCAPATVPKGAKEATTTCDVGPTTTPGEYILVATVTAAGKTASRQGSFRVIQVGTTKFGHGSCVGVGIKHHEGITCGGTSIVGIERDCWCMLRQALDSPASYVPACGRHATRTYRGAGMQDSCPKECRAAHVTFAGLQIQCGHITCALLRPLPLVFCMQCDPAAQLCCTNGGLFAANGSPCRW